MKKKKKHKHKEKKKRNNGFSSFPYSVLALLTSIIFIIAVIFCLCDYNSFTFIICFLTFEF